MREITPQMLSGIAPEIVPETVPEIVPEIALEIGSVETAPQIVFEIARGSAQIVPEIALLR